MTDIIEEPVANSEADNSEHKEPAEDTTSGGSTNWQDGLQDEDNRKAAKDHQWKDMDAVVKSYRELNTRLGKSLTPPDENATTKEREKWQQQLRQLNNVPESHERYQFAMPEGLPEHMPYDHEFLEAFKKTAFSSGLSPDQALAMHDFYIKHTAEGYTARQKQIEDAHALIEEAWGKKGSEPYNRHQQLANRSIKHLGGEALYKEMVNTGVLGEQGAVLKPHLAFAFARAGEKLFAEDRLFGESGSLQGNPFDENNKAFSLEVQGALIKHDPKRAKKLIKQAGEDPDLYGL